MGLTLKLVVGLALKLALGVYLGCDVVMGLVLRLAPDFGQVVLEDLC